MLSALCARVHKKTKHVQNLVQRSFSVKMVYRLSISAKREILSLWKDGKSTVRIAEILEEKMGIRTTRQSVRRFIVRSSKPTLARKRVGILTKLHKDFINLWMERNPEISACELVKKLHSTFGVTVTRQHIGIIRRALGWTCQRIKYCQLFSSKNVDHRLTWCLRSLHVRDTFEDVIFVDETGVEMSSAGRIFHYKPTSSFDKLPSKAPKPKHAHKVHVWAGISYRGRTNCCIFTGIMDSKIYQSILQDNFLPFVARNFPDGYRLYQDNDSKHKSKSTRKWMEEVGMLDSVMETPASSPDLNPIENLWSAMKNHLQTKVKPKKKDELVRGIRAFWEALTAKECGRYIDHIHRVIPHVVLNRGNATQF